MQGSQRLAFPVYLNNLTHLLIFTFALLIVLLSFGYVNEVEYHNINEVDSQNKYRKYDLSMGKYWVTQCGWLWLCKTVSTGIIITNLWKIFCYGVKRYHYEKSIDIR